MIGSVADKLIRCLPESIFVRRGCGMAFPEDITVNAGEKSVWIIEDGILDQGEARFIVNENAELFIIRLQLVSENHSIHTFTRINQAAGSCCHMLNVIASFGNIENDLSIALEGIHAQCDVDSIILCGSKANCIQKTNIHHLSADCSSNQIVKMIMGNESHAEFDGLIKVYQDAQHTQAYQRCNSLLISEKASSIALPHLEIYADDVKCSHGATVGQLDKEALFYMQNRGISFDNARKLLVGAFANEPIEKISNEEVRNTLEMMIADTLQNI